MSSNYREKFYSRYVATHASAYSGIGDINSTKRQFPVWKSYFGGFLPCEKSAKILDVGCGDGGLVFWLNCLGFNNAFGIDASEEQIELSKKLGIANTERADIFEYLKKSADSFDLIFARDVLEHFNKDEVCEILELVRRSLKSGGVFVAQTANAENLLWGRIRYGDFTHESAFTERSAKQVFMVAGFENVSVAPQRPFVHGAVSFVRLVFWRIFEVLIKLYLLIETGSASGIFTQNIIISGSNKPAKIDNK